MKKSEMIRKFRECMIRDFNAGVNKFHVYDQLDLEHMSYPKLCQLHRSFILNTWSHETTELKWNIDLYSHPKHLEWLKPFGYKDLKGE